MATASNPALITYHGRPLPVVDGQPRVITAYSPVNHQQGFEKSVPRFFADGLLAYFINAPRGSGPWGTNPLWVGDDIAPDYLMPAVAPDFDQQVQFILAGDPDARFLIRFGLLEPPSWRQLHADQLVVNERGEQLDTPSLASVLFHQDCARYVQAVVGYCERQPWADRVIGYANFLRYEGSHDPLMQGWLFDHSELMRQRWRQFLTAKYRDDAALRQAWADESVTVAAAAVPTDLFKRNFGRVTQSLFWQAGPENQPLRDYLELTKDLVESWICDVSAAQAAATDKLFLYDGFKQVMLGWHNHGFFAPGKSWPVAYHDMMAGAGHIGVAEMFDLDGFDGLITPHDYQARGLGGIFEPEGAADSMVLRGKLMLVEMDTRSYTGRDYIYPAQNDREFAVITWRNIATALTRGFQLYWMDVHEDWFGSAGIHEVIRQQASVLAASVDWPHVDVPGIAMIIDDASVLETNGNGAYLNEAIMQEIKTGLARCGVPARYYLLEDLALDNFPEHRVFYFPNLFKVDDQRLALLRKKVFRDGHVVLWGPGSGISDGHSIGAEHAERLTGFTFDLVPLNYPRRVQIQDYSHPITAGLDEGQLLGSPLAYGPLLFPKDGRSLGAAWTKQGRLHSGLSIKEMDGGAWHSVFTTAVPIPANMWRGLAISAGAHVYCDSNDLVLADQHIVAMHAIRSGRKALRFPQASRVFDVISGTVVAELAEHIEFDLQAPDTRIFRLEF